MNNVQIAHILESIADLLELKGEIPFKIRAYQRAARAIENLPVEAEQLLKEGRLREVPGVGEALTKKIAELVSTGKLDYYERLRAEFPEGLSLLMDVPGIGPKTALLLSRELGISTLEELERALVAGRVAELPRMGEKAAENILRHLRSFRRKDERIPLGQALPVVEGILDQLRQIPGLQDIAPAGSLRRLRETVGDVDIMGTAAEPERVIRTFTSLPQVKEVLAAGSTKGSVVVEGDLQVDLRLVDPDSFGSTLQYFTGSKEHNISLRERGLRQGLSLSEYGITVLKTETLEKFRSEEDFYQRLGLAFIPPELREDRGEIERAEQGALPQLVETAHLKGDLHTHTEWSDGHNSIEEMALAARARGYQYLAITDHSPGRGISRGLREERLRQQMAEIAALNERLEGIRLLMGIEVDIRAESTLDLPDELLAELDIVVAAVHSAMGQDEVRMTQRIISALENPHVDILAHPSCRLLGERAPVDADWEEVFKAAARTGTALEVNAMPSRLDLKDIHAYRARELGVKLVISTDAHSPAQLDFIRFGVGVARRAWCEPAHILNTLPLEGLLASLKNSRR
jgi:DNA polymerase (family 10)